MKLKTLFPSVVKWSWSLVGMIGLLVALPFGGTILSWSLIVALFFWIVDWNWKTKIETLNHNKWYWLFFLFYVMVCVGYLYSTDKVEASFKMLQKVVLVLLPLCFATTALARNRTAIINAFVYSLALNCLMLELHSIWQYIQTGDVGVFFYDLYSYFLHPSYFALLVSIALVVALLNSMANNISQGRKSMWILLSLFFSLNVLQSSSRAAQLGLVFVWLIVAIVYLRQSKWLVYTMKLALLTIPILTIALGFLFSQQTRLTTLRYAQNMDGASRAHAESGQVRLLIWKEAINLIKKQPLLGYGTGDVGLVMDQRYGESGMTDARDKHLNVHNQYLQTSVANGVLTLLILLSIFIWGTLKALRQNDYIALGFFLLMGFNLLFESMLERREGLFTFAVFCGLFLSNNVKGHEKSSSPILS